MGSKDNIEDVLQTLTLDEKISLLAGGSFSDLKAIPEKGVPLIKTADGPNGVRSAAIDVSIRSACFPAACCVASTFDVGIARQMGHALAEEARGKGVHCMLGPTVCIHRHPLGGRNFESFSEDPFLAGKMSSQVIQGLQSFGISATIKHFAANEQETQRTSVDETISERALREIYLRPFEIAIKEAKPWAVMTAYNLINGVHCDANEWLLKHVLRGEWRWSGLVMSDWGGTNSVADALNAGLDLEMPGPPRIRKVDKVKEAIERGEISEDVLTERVRSVLEWSFKLKDLENQAEPIKASDKPEHRALIRDAGARGIVLLKNVNDILPLTKEKVKGKKIALIGFAKDAMAHGGGSASVNAYYKVSPWQGLQAALGDSAEFLYAKGAHRERLLPPITRDSPCGTVVGLDGQPGFTRLLFEGDSDEPCSVLHGQLQSAYSPLGSQESLWKSLELVGDFIPSETGNHYIACSGLGPTRITIDDKVIFEQKGNCTDPMGSLFLAAPEEEVQHHFKAGQTYRIRIKTDPPTKIGLEILEGRSGVRAGFSLESDHDADLEGEAADIASCADFAIVFTGHDPQWETEGRDQDSFNLPRRGTQDSLVSAVAAANKNTIVVNSTGVAIATPWLSHVQAFVQAWFSGQECGNAIADVLTGAVNPEGRLPMTFPSRIEDAPAHGNFPGKYVNGQLKVDYAEGVFVGYRHFDRLEKKTINFPFGFGLSYTEFEFGKMQVHVEDGRKNVFNVSLSVTNIGKVAGGTLVQIYAGRSKAVAEHPIKALVGFQKVRLQPGEQCHASVQVSAQGFAFFHEGQKQWVVEEGDYTISLGASAAEMLQSRQVKVMGMVYGP
ncbi:hypothetical protein S7711_05822 [Stachybotrys chartarum IBT 7711]|uniref:beta-glucosidase n=1 Tax=Stachybotrys chartarum (strain CBS 109288 / IBT 7711) TaxID=1280523 RepID=A0A084AM60_STACB|nr:hypothetical protein S7711_05822 [Stachybotrys chartarum IBT 7711]